MNKEKWHEKADELIDAILDLKEKVKRNKEDLDSMKMELVNLLESKNVNDMLERMEKLTLLTLREKVLLKKM